MLDVRYKILVFCLLIFVSFNLFSQTENKLVFDTTTNAIIDFDKKDEWQRFYIDSNCKSSILSQNDLKVIDSLLKIVMVRNKVGDTSILHKYSNIQKFDSLITIITLYEEQKDTFHYKQADSEFKKEFYDNIYLKQLIPFENTKKEKIVFVNCYLSSKFSSIIFKSWKISFVQTMDGGNCCFRFKINLATKQYFDFEVNEVGG